MLPGVLPGVLPGELPEELPGEEQPRDLPDGQPGKLSYERFIKEFGEQKNLDAYQKVHEKNIGPLPDVCVFRSRRPCPSFNRKIGVRGSSGRATHNRAARAGGVHPAGLGWVRGESRGLVSFEGLAQTGESFGHYLLCCSLDTFVKRIAS